MSRDDVGYVIRRRERLRFPDPVRAPHLDCELTSIGISGLLDHPMSSGSMSLRVHKTVEAGVGVVRRVAAVVALIIIAISSISGIGLISPHIAGSG